jgi:hypothetical protein
VFLSHVVERKMEKTGDEAREGDGSFIRADLAAEGEKVHARSGLYRERETRLATAQVEPT